MKHVKKVVTSFLFLLLLFICIISEVLGQEKLTLVITLMRHGDRTPCYSIPKSPIEFDSYLGELTALGIHQTYILGKSFRKRYVDELCFLPQKYESDSIYVRSSDVNRTIVSAQSFLCGLYPPGTGPMLDDVNPALPYAYQPIPVRTMPREEDRVILGARFDGEKLENMLKELVYSSTEWKKMTSLYKEKFNRWSDIFGLKIEGLQDLVKPGDNLNVRLLKGIPLPKGLSLEEACEIVKIYQWVLAEQVKPRKIAFFVAKDFLNELIAQMDKAVNGTQKYRMIVYSGHDVTMLPVLSAIGSPLSSQVPYASYVSFELYRSCEEHFVRVIFNDNNLSISFNNGAQYCPYERFKVSLQDEAL